MMKRTLIFILLVFGIMVSTASAVTIGEVIGWKFNHQEGMRTKAGVIIEFPGGIPSQADQDLWTAEYLARDVDLERVEKVFRLTDRERLIFELMFEMINRVLVLEGNAVITRAQFKDFLKAKLP